jgi:hypothetical protein
MPICSICGGYGRVQGAIAPFSPILQELPCPACDGLGVVQLPILKPHSGKVKPLSARAKAKIGERRGSLKRIRIAREFLKP